MSGEGRAAKGGTGRTPSEESVISDTALRQMRATVREVPNTAVSSTGMAMGGMSKPDGIAPLETSGSPTDTPASSGGAAPGQAAAQDAGQLSQAIHLDAPAPLAALPEMAAATQGPGSPGGIAGLPGVAPGQDAAAARDPLPVDPPDAAPPARVPQPEAAAAGDPSGPVPVAAPRTTPVPPPPTPPVSQPPGTERIHAVAPDLRAADAAGAEDEAIPLDLRVALERHIGSARLTVLVEGLPPGASLSAGIRQPGGGWLLSASELAGLRVLPPADVSGEFPLRVTAFAENAASGTAARSAAITLRIAPRTEEASLGFGGEGTEDGWIPLHPQQLDLGTDTDGSERLAATLQIGGVPPGAALSVGVETAPGIWTVPTAALLEGRVALRPPADSAEPIRLSVTATLEDMAGTMRDTRTLVSVAEVRVAAVADGPVVRAGDVAGTEDGAIALDLSAALSDLDGSETLAVSLLGLPAGAVLSAGTREADGSWTLDPADLPGLVLTPPADFAGTLALTLRAVATEGANGDAAVRERAFAVEVAAAMDGAGLLASASGAEDTAIPILAAFGVSPDPSEAWDAAAVIRGVPAGASLTQGTDLGGGAWRVDRAELAAGRVAVVPQADSDAPIALTIETAIHDHDGGGASRAVTASLVVAVAAVADGPVVRAGDVAGTEDGAIALDLSAALSDLDGSETLAVSLLGLPAGAVLSAGRREADGSWTLDPADLPGLALTPPRDFAGDVALTLSASSRETRGGGSATSTAGFTMHVAPQADAAVVTAAGEGNEGSWIPIRGTLATTDTDGSERLGPAITVVGVPAGAVLSHGSEVSPGTWSVPRAAFEGGLLAIRPPAGSDADIALRIGAQVLDGTAAATTEANATIVVRAVADAPIVQVADARGLEDQPIRLAGLGGALADTDGSETLHFVLSGVPSSASLSAGTRNADGSWTLTPAQLGNVSLTPPANFSGSLRLTLTAVATEARDGVAPASCAASFTVGVDPVAEAGSIAGRASGNEDSFITLRPAFATTDADGSESWAATSRISGVPAGAQLSRGTEVSPGVWEVATADLRGGLVAIRPPAGSDADFALTIRTTLQDTGNGVTATREVTGTQQVVVRAVADAPVVAAHAVTGAEDQPIRLNLSATLADTDGSETLGLVLEGVPDGATLSAGTRNADGTWSVPAASLPTLSLTPPRDFSGTINLTFRATSTEQDGGTATSFAAFAVQVQAVADAPTVRVGPALGREDEAIALRISGAATDLDRSERIVGFRLTDVPQGATVRAGGAVLARQPDGSVLVDAAAAPTLSITPPPDADADFTLRVAAIAEEPNGSRAESAPRDLPVLVDAVADAPVWLRLGAAGQEDTAIPLEMGAHLADQDGSERLYYVVSGLPPGSVLSTGTYRGDGSWSLTVAEAASVTLTPPRDFAGTINLTARAVSQEQNCGDEAVSTIAYAVRVTAVVDSTGFDTTARGDEDTPIPLDLIATLGDVDGSEQMVGTVVIQGIPTGAVLRLADGTAVAGSNGLSQVPADRVAGVTLTMPPDSDASCKLSVTATIEDTGGVRAEVHGTVTVDAIGDADGPQGFVTFISTMGTNDRTGASGWINLPITVALRDMDGSESLHLWVRDMPDGFSLSAGIPTGDGTWLVQQADLADLKFRPPVGFSGEAPLRVQAVTVEREGDTRPGQASRPVTIFAAYGSPTGTDYQAQAPSLTASAAAGTEDTASALNIAAALRNTDGGMERLGIRVTGLPAGSTLSAGFYDQENDAWILPPAQLAGLRVTPPENFSGSIAVRVTAVAVERNGNMATTSQDLTLSVTAVADGPAISATPAAGAEDQAVPLNLVVAPADADGSERVLSITLSGLSPGTSIAPATGVRNNGDGTWTVDPAAAGNVRLVPPADAFGTYTLTVTATTTEASNGATATASRVIGVAVAPRADAPLLAVADAAGQEDRPVALALSAALADTDGSEVLSIAVSGLPEGVRLSAGVNNGDGSWTLTPAQLQGLTLTAPQDWSGRLILTVEAHAMERSTGEVATTRTTLRVDVAGVADAPLVDAPDGVWVTEDEAAALDIVAQLTDRDGSEALSLVVTGVPAGGSLSAGTANPDGSWTVPASALPGLAVMPPPDFSGTLRLDFAAIATEAGGDATAVRFQVPVAVAPVADAPVLAAANATGPEDQPVALNLSAALGDTDGSESFAALRVTGLPAGFRLSAGRLAADGGWDLQTGDLAGLSLATPRDWNGTLNLTLQATAQDGTETASASRAFAVTVAPVNDAPVLALGAPAGAAGGQVTAAAIGDAQLSDVDDARLSGATITLSGAQAGDRLALDGYQLRAAGGRVMVGDTGIEIGTAPDGTVTLAGPAPVATYERVLESLVIENTGGGLRAGTRGIAITVHDEAGAASATQLVSLPVTPSVLQGGLADGTLTGTAGHDTFIGGAGDETMLGGAGAELFVVAMGGGHDRVEGGGGSWTDTIKVSGAGAHGMGGWTLVLDGGGPATLRDDGFDFAQPASGHIQFADGMQVEFLQIERVTW